MLGRLRSNDGKVGFAVIIIAVLVMALIGTGVLLFLGKGKAGGGKAAAKEEKKPDKVVQLQEFVVNLADVDEAHYLKLEMGLAVPEDAKIDAGGGGEGGGEGGGQMAMIRDGIICVTSKHTYADLLKEDGKEKLKSEIRAELKKRLKVEVNDVYFTNFAMQ